jgi:serine/threonine protein kinase
MSTKRERSGEYAFIDGEPLDGKYRVEGLLGQGGMGAVYRATHLGTKRTVAVKVIRPRLSAGREFVERFRREAEAAGRLRHPNVVDVTDFGFARVGAEQVAYLVMEYLDGCTLAEVLAEEGKLPVTWVADILDQVCSAVDEAHRAGVVHRDLKPENIWLEPNRRGGYTVKVLDFGLAKLDAPAQVGAPPAVDAARSASPTEADTRMLSHEAEDAETLLKPAVPTDANDSSVGTLLSVGADDALESSATVDLTRAGSVMGTPLYMSPEQCLGRPPDARSDVYSLGVVAYRMLAGETPFTGTFDELRRLHCEAVPVPVRERNRAVPRRMARVVMAALAKDPAERPESAAGFASALRAGSEGSGTLLRRAASLYAEHFPTFLKISLLAYAPLIVLLTFFYFMEYVIAPEDLPGSLVGPLVFLGLISASVFSYFACSAAAVPVVIQVMVAPLRPPRVRTALAALGRRLPALVATSVALMAMTLGGAALLVVPGVLAAVWHVLYAPVTVMESGGVWATLKRARALASRSWSTVLVITAVQFTLPVLVWVAAIDSDLVFRVDENYAPKEFSFNFSMSGNTSLFQLLNVFITPLTAIMGALLYLKTRHAGGESLGDTVARLDALEITRSRWEARMRSRSLTRTSTGSVHEIGTGE